MANDRRQYAGGAVKTTLVGGTLSSGGTSITMAAATGWPTGAGNFVIVMNRGNATEEKILCASLSGTTITVAASGRGYDGTSAASHLIGEAIELTASAIGDFNEANNLVSQTLGAVTTAGDMLYATGAGALARLPAGTTGQVLIGGTAPTFTGSPSITQVTTSGNVIGGGETSGLDLKASGLTGAANVIRVVGGNASGAPLSGTFQARDAVVNTDGTVWVCTVGGSPGTWSMDTAALVTTKGDLLAGTGSKAISRLGVGSNTQVLTADSTQATGMKWAPLSSAGAGNGRPWLLRRTGAVTETFPRQGLIDSPNLATGTIFLSAIPMLNGDVVTNLAWYSGSTATASPTHWWFVFCDSGRIVRAVTADQTNGAWGANTEQIIAATSPYTIPSDGLYYLGVMVAAATPPSLWAAQETNTGPVGLAPILTGTSNTAQTTPPTTGTTLNALSAIGNYFWGYVS